MELNTKYQDNLLLSDILYRNYYISFKEDTGYYKDFNLCFFYNNSYLLNHI